MQTYNMHHAKTHLSELIALAEAGEEVILSRANKPVAKIVPLNPQPQKRVAGLFEGKGWVSDDFDDELPADFLITARDWPAPDVKKAGE